MQSSRKSVTANGVKDSYQSSSAMTASEVQVQPPAFLEKQRWYQCGLHAVNNLLQRPVYAVEDFEAIANEVSAIVPGIRHKACLGLGCYGAEVVCAAVARQGLCVDTLNCKNTDVALRRLSGPNVVGLLLNEVESDRRWWQLWRSQRHWLAAVRRATETNSSAYWWIIDSQNCNGRPQKPLDTRALVSYIVQDMVECVVFIVERRNEL